MKNNKSNDENLDYQPGFWFTFLMMLPFMAALDVVLFVREQKQRWMGKK